MKDLPPIFYSIEDAIEFPSPSKEDRDVNSSVEVPIQNYVPSSLEVFSE